MFFLPAIKELGEKNLFFVLCLSNGNADGLGKIREREFEKSMRHLNI